MKNWIRVFHTQDIDLYVEKTILACHIWNVLFYETCATSTVASIGNYVKRNKQNETRQKTTLF